MMKCNFKIKLFLLFLLLTRLIVGAPNPTQLDVPAEVDVHFPILLNILSFDRNFKQRMGNEIILGIIYQEKFRQSLDMKNQVENYLVKSKTNRLEGIPLRFISIDFHSARELKNTLEKEKVKIIYIAPLRAIPVSDITDISKSLKITSLTGVPGYCDSGISVGVGSKGGAPLIIINLAAATAEGIDFSSRLLKLAKVIDNNNRME